MAASRLRRKVVALAAAAGTLLLASVAQPSAAPRGFSALAPLSRVAVIGDSVAAAILYGTKIGKVTSVVGVNDAAGTPASRRLTLRIRSRSPASAVAVETPTAASVVTYPPRVTMITDSVGGVLFWVASQRERLAQGLDFRLEAKTCRKLVSPGCYAYEEVPPSVLETVAKLGPELGHLVIVYVGYNDVAESYADGLDTVMGALTAQGVERVVWVTLHESQQTWAQINDQIRAGPKRWPQLVVADWAPVAAREPSWFVDGAHMNDLGAEGFVTFLRPVVLEACGTACVPPEATATMLAPVVRRGHVTLRWSGNPFARTYDVALRQTGGAWRTIVARLARQTYRAHGIPGARMQARVRAHDDSGVAGSWSPPQSFRL